MELSIELTQLLELWGSILGVSLTVLIFMLTIGQLMADWLRSL
jgi:hypothetical protein